jgi:hypothetical protein
MSGKGLPYFAEDGAIVGTSSRHFNNRPLYANNRDDVIIGGDVPLIRFGRKPFLYGTLRLGAFRAGQSLWLEEADNIRMTYRAGRLSWRLADERFPGLVLEIDVVPVVGRTGMAVRLRVAESTGDVALFWTFGGLRAELDPNADFDTAVSKDVLRRGFLPSDGSGNQIVIDGACFRISASPVNPIKNDEPALAGHAMGRCSGSPALSVIETGAEIGSIGTPLVHGTLSLTRDPIFWGIIGLESVETPGCVFSEDLGELFQQGWERGKDLAARVSISTPEKRLDALAAASVAAIDGTWYPPCFVHSAMLWNIPYPGWRTIFGGTMYGWHDRVAETAAYFIASQVKSSELLIADADSNRLLTMQSLKSRFYGKGRITAHSGFYDMQSQFFDQMITAWRWNPTDDFEALLRPALDLHLDWMQECFDPDGDGAYESYINSWPTDSVWYNGGGSCEATSYAYRGHVAAASMAQRAGDVEAEKRHQQIATSIRNGFFTQLWIERLGHPGKYREQGGHRRLHENPSLYGIFLPIDAGLLSPQQAATTLNYAKTTLQNDVKASGGRMVWTSNWVPSIWSTRVDWPGDNYALALAYFQAGFAEDGWDIFRGTFIDSAYAQNCPGNLGHQVAGYDFGDCSHTFSRTLVEGLFGFQPDYPNGIVRIRPQFPEDWNNASIQIPDFSLRFRRKDLRLEYEIELKKAATLELELPVRAWKVLEVTADNRPISVGRVPGINSGVLRIKLPHGHQTKVSIQLADPFPIFSPLDLYGETGHRVEIDLEGDVVRVIDSQRLFENSHLAGNCFSATLGDNPGHHLALFEIRVGEMTILRPVQVTIHASSNRNPTIAETLEAPSQGAVWEVVDLTPHFNCDVREIFKQAYLSPRPNTVSLRLGTDGWTPWTSTFWGQKPPEISLERAPGTGNPAGQLITPLGVPFKIGWDSANILFTSLWDNFPTSASIPFSQAAEAIWLLIAGSTNPMQCGIANAVVRLEYADATTETFDLKPPQNFWALAPICISGSAAGQEGRFDYTDPVDAFCVPKPHPKQVQLGKNCRAMIYGFKLKEGAPLRAVGLETLSQEVVIGIMGVSLMNPCPAKTANADPGDSNRRLSIESPGL